MQSRNMPEIDLRNGIFTDFSFFLFTNIRVRFLGQIFITSWNKIQFTGDEMNHCCGVDDVDDYISSILAILGP